MMSARFIAARPAKRLAQVPRWLRPKLSRDQIRDLGIVHAGNVDEIHRGVATEQTLWDMVHTTLAWSHVADRLARGISEITPQLELLSTMLTRYNSTGRIGFEGDEYALAKTGIAVMDAFAELVDQQLATEAVIWADQKTSRWRCVNERLKGQIEGRG